MTYTAIDNSQSVIRHYGKKGMKWRKNRPPMGEGSGIDQHEQAIETNDMAIRNNTALLLKNKLTQIGWELNKEKYYKDYVKETKKAGEKPMSYKDMVKMARTNQKASNDEYRNRIKQHVKNRNILTGGTGGKL